MLINGDLVRIPQGTIINQQGYRVRPMPVAIVNTPMMGIVLDSRDAMAKVLMNDEVIYVEKKLLQLVGGK